MVDDPRDDGVADAATLAWLRDRLLAAQATLRDQLADTTGLTDTVALDQSAMGRVSRNDALLQQQMALATQRRHQLRAERVAAALERMDDEPDEFGWCPDCGEPIAWKRLVAFPEVVFCVRCAEARGA